MQNFTFYSPTYFAFLCLGDGRQGSISGFVTLDEADCAKIYRMMARA